MNDTKQWIGDIRKSFVNAVMEDLLAVKYFNSLHFVAFHKGASLCLQAEGKKEKLLEREEWSGPRCKDDLLDVFHEFFEKHLK